MIPDYVQEALNCPGTAVLATRDSQLQPCLIRTFGIQIHPNQKTATCYIHKLRSEQIIANLENNGRIAFTIAIPGTNESYQLKGRYVLYRQNSEQDDQFLDEYMGRVSACAKDWGLTEEQLASFNLAVYKPSIAVTFEVETVFGQAPRPETGNPIS